MYNIFKLSSHQSTGTIIAIISLIIAIINLSYVIKIEERTSQEILEIKISQPENTYPAKIIKIHGTNNNISFYKTYILWKVILINKTTNPISIVELESFDYNKKPFSERIGVYSNTSLGSFELPINIEPGFSKKIYISTPAILHQSINKYISESYPSNEGIIESFFDFRKYLYKVGQVDIFGNKLSRFWFGEGWPNTYEPPSINGYNPYLKKVKIIGAYNPNIYLNFTSSTGKKFAASQSWYGN